MNPERAVLLGLLLVATAPARAQTPIEVAGVYYESPSLAAPAVALILPRDGGQEWRIRVTGWTAQGEWRQTLNPTDTVAFSANITPVNAHGSNAVYRDGVRQTSLSYRDATFELGASWEKRNAGRRLSALKVLGLYESVQDLPPDLERRWRAPFVGLEVAHTVGRFRSEEEFGTRAEGWNLSVHARGFVGSRTLGQLEGTAYAGRRFGTLWLRAEGTSYAGRDLDTVSDFLVGGCWDQPAAGTLYGYRYGEFRISSGALVSAAADVRLAGLWEVGIRSGHLFSPDVSRQGHAVRVGKRWGGVVLHAGVGVPQDSRLEWGRAVAFAGIILATSGRPARF
jgi:hypothetical protein